MTTSPAAPVMYSIKFLVLNFFLHTKVLTVMKISLHQTLQMPTISLKHCSAISSLKCNKCWD